MKELRNYGLLKVGDIFCIEGQKKAYLVESIEVTPAGGCGMGEHPAHYKITTSKGWFNYDDWSEHTYRSYAVIGHVDQPERGYITDHLI